MRDMNTKALICAAALYFTQENDVLTMLFDADSIIHDACKPSLQLAQFMIMRGKQRLGTNFVFINQILYNSPRNTQAIERTGSSADFIQHNQRMGALRFAKYAPFHSFRP